MADSAFAAIFTSKPAHILVPTFDLDDLPRLKALGHHSAIGGIEYHLEAFILCHFILLSLA
jgi:hypothetical protein